MEPLTVATLGASILLAMSLACVAGLKGWTAWLANRGPELASQPGDHSLPPATGRIELADLKERVRKLEAIAAGIDI